MKDLKWTRVADDEFGNRHYRLKPNDVFPVGHEFYDLPWHDLAVPEVALDDRAHLYGLDRSNESSIETHIIWEHYLVTSPDSPEDHLPAEVKTNFDRVWGPGHKPARGKQLTEAEHLEQVQRMNEIRKPKKPEDK